MRDIKSPKEYDNLQLISSEYLVLYKKLLASMLGGDKKNEEIVTESSKLMSDSLDKSSKSVEKIQALKYK
ncbi:TPA: hypothetical protein ACJMKJ_004449 [Bacillus wiedmannii]